MNRIIIVILLLGFMLSACADAEPGAAPTPMFTQTQVPIPLATLTPPELEIQVLSTKTPMVDKTPTLSSMVFDAALLGSVQRSVTYCQSPDGTNLTMDIEYPAQGQAPFPTVLYVHGGSWIAGDKSEGRYIPMRTELVRGGNIFVSINYRLAPDYRFPAQIEDVKCAVRGLRANADALGVDPNRIAAMGSSAGGHLVSLLGTADESAGWDASGSYPGVSSRVSAVVDLFGPAVPEGPLSRHDLDLLSQVFGARNVEDGVLEQASPVTYATPDDPPFLILHGTLDSTVPLSQSQRLAELLKASGVDARLIVVENAGHGLPSNGQATRPSFAEIMVEITGFLEKNIGRGA